MADVACDPESEASHYSLILTPFEWFLAFRACPTAPPFAPNEPLTLLPDFSGPLRLSAITPPFFSGKTRDPTYNSLPFSPLVYSYFQNYHPLETFFPYRCGRPRGSPWFYLCFPFSFADLCPRDFPYKVFNPPTHVWVEPRNSERTPPPPLTRTSPL